MGLYVAIPSLYGVRPQTVGCVAQLMVELSKVLPDSELGILPGCSDIRIARTTLAGNFLLTKHGHTLLLDDDIVVSHDTIARMYNVDADIVVAAYKKRHGDHAYAIRLLEGLDHPSKSPMRIVDGERLIEIAAAGLGCTLVKRKVVETLWNKHPELTYYSTDDSLPLVMIFQPGIYEAEGKPRALGEDFAFFQRARAAGFKVECLVDAPTDHAGFIGNLAEFFPAPSA